jgi:hypothetical protein
MCAEGHLEPKRERHGEAHENEGTRTWAREKGAREREREFERMRVTKKTNERERERECKSESEREREREKKRVAQRVVVDSDRQR